MAMYTFTSNDILDILITKANSATVLLIYDEKQYYETKSMQEIIKKIPESIKIKPSNSMMHNKYAIIDNEIVITGSANWTNAAMDG
jgi:phosphatidylserine/phosphatidylglycerophosphate/cardiolipin synthase-like enzyme